MIKRQTLYVLAVLFMVSLFAAPVSAIPEATIGIGGGTGEITLPITVTDSTNVGAMTVNLTYDESVVIVTGAIAGDMDTTVLNLENTADGWIRIVAYQTGAYVLDSDFILATIAFEPVGSPGSCPLEISVETFKDSTPGCNAMPYTVSNGTYTTMVCTSVTLSPAGPFDIYVGNAFELTANCTDQYGDEIECSELDWRSDNMTVGEIFGGVFEAYAPGTANVTATGCGVSNSVQVNVTVDPDPEPTPTATARRSSGGSGSGTYPPGWGSSTSSNTTQPDNETSVPTPTSTEPPKSPTMPDDSGETNVTDKGKPKPTPTPDTPGFIAVFAIAGILGIAYLIGRRRE